MSFTDMNLKTLARRYRQLLLPVREGISGSDEFKNVVLHGIIPNSDDAQWLETMISSMSVETPAGRVEIVLGEKREDFIRLYQSLGYRCEPADIPDSVGAAMISGLINWEKIDSHKADYLEKGNTDWAEEFKRFTADKKNYRDALILISNGPYSAVPAAQFHLSDAEWKGRSVIIRIYHEITHFVCRNLYPDMKNPLRDEVYADCIGLIAAFGEYNPLWARTFLGIESDTYRKGGRLEHYDPDCSEEAVQQAGQWISEAEKGVLAIWDRQKWDSMSDQDRNQALFGLLAAIY